MPAPRLVGPLPQSTPSGGRGSRATRPIPEDLLRDASLRLSIMSLLGAVLWVLGTIGGHLAFRAMTGGDPRWAGLDGTDALAATSVVVSLAMFAYSRRPGNDPARVLDVGLGYMVYTGLALGLMLHLGDLPAGTTLQPMISWVGVVLLMFAAIVPTPPRKFLAAALLAVAMTPLSMLLARARGAWHFASAWDILLMHYPDVLLIGVAVVISKVVTTLGQQVSRAREMGSYHLGELLGSGGMGQVYLARHRMLARPAAIKLIRPEMLAGRAPGSGSSGPDVAIRRFRREAEAAANLRSPHTVALYDFGVTEDDTLYFVMELLEGMDLETLVRKHGPLPANRAIHILRQLCDSLDEAHAYGLVHRDIKPANIHLGRVGLRHDFVKVLDFGLVKEVGTKDAERSLVTGGGITPGTPAYMAPETALGEHVDGRADLYAVGCVAFYLLTGRLVFEADNTVQLIVKHLEAEPPPPSRFARFPVPASLDAVVLACLRKEPARRPATAGELAGLLGEVEVEPWGEAEAAAWWREHPPRATPAQPAAAD